MWKDGHTSAAPQVAVRLPGTLSLLSQFLHSFWGGCKCDCKELDGTGMFSTFALIDKPGLLTQNTWLLDPSSLDRKFPVPRRLQSTRLLHQLTFPTGSSPSSRAHASCISSLFPQAPPPPLAHASCISSLFPQAPPPPLAHASCISSLFPQAPPPPEQEIDGAGRGERAREETLCLWR